MSKNSLREPENDQPFSPPVPGIGVITARGEKRIIGIGYAGATALFSAAKNILSPEDRMLAGLTVLGASTEEIGHQVGAKEEAVYARLEGMYRELNIDSPTQLLGRLLLAGPGQFMAVKKYSDESSPIHGLAEPELDIARLTAEGLDKTQIKDELGISFKDLKGSLKAIAQRVGTNNRVLVGTAYTLHTEQLPYEEGQQLIAASEASYSQLMLLNQPSTLTLQPLPEILTKPRENA